MYIEAFELDINNISNYNKDDIKNFYKKIALECHPDKLFNIKDPILKNNKIERFKNASIAYKLALEDFDNYGKLSNKIDNSDFGYNYNFDDLAHDFNIYKDIDVNYWKDILYNKDTIQKTFMSMANLFLKKGVKSNSYYNPSTKIIKHDISLKVTYYDLYNSKKKKLSILLKNIKDPFNISILCKKEYPQLTRQYIDDDGIEHEIVINMILADKNNMIREYTHKINNNNIDLFTDITINLQEYILGITKEIQYIDNNYINITIPPFCGDSIEIINKGLLGGSLNVKIRFINITNKKWDNIDDIKKENFIKILDDIYK